METNTREKLERDLKYHRKIARAYLGGVAVETMAVVLPLNETFHPDMANFVGLSLAGIFAGCSKWQHGKQMAIERQLRGLAETDGRTEPIAGPALLTAPVPVD